LTADAHRYRGGQTRALCHLRPARVCTCLVSMVQTRAWRRLLEAPRVAFPNVPAPVSDPRAPNATPRARDDGVALRGGMRGRFCRSPGLSTPRPAPMSRICPPLVPTGVVPCPGPRLGLGGEAELLIAPLDAPTCASALEETSTAPSITASRERSISSSRAIQREGSATVPNPQLPAAYACV
jgi:hypothetical protein